MNNQSFSLLDEHFQAIIQMPETRRAEAIADFGKEHPELLKTLQDLSLIHI